MFSCWIESAVLQYFVNECFSFSHHWMKRSMQWQIGSIDHLSDQLSFHLSLFQVAVNPVLTCHWCLYSLAVIFQCKKGPQLYMRLRNVCCQFASKKKGRWLHFVIFLKSLKTPRFKAWWQRATTITTNNNSIRLAKHQLEACIVLLIKETNS